LISFYLQLTGKRDCQFVLFKWTPATFSPAFTCQLESSRESCHRESHGCHPHPFQTPFQIRRCECKCVPILSNGDTHNCWMKRPACDETVQFVGICEHCHSVASCGCRIFQSLPCCWLSCTSICPQVRTCSLWNISCTSCTSNTLLRRCGSMFGFRSLHSMSDVDWCCGDGLTAPLLARLRRRPTHGLSWRLTPSFLAIWETHFFLCLLLLGDLLDKPSQHAGHSSTRVNPVDGCSCFFSIVRRLFTGRSPDCHLVPCR